MTFISLTIKQIFSCLKCLKINCKKMNWFQTKTTKGISKHHWEQSWFHTNPRACSFVEIIWKAPSRDHRPKSRHNSYLTVFCFEISVRNQKLVFSNKNSILEVKLFLKFQNEPFLVPALGRLLCWRSNPNFLF